MKRLMSILLILGSCSLFFCGEKKESIVHIEGLTRTGNLFLEERINQLKELAKVSTIIQAIEISNKKNMAFTQEKIDSLDQEWMQHNSEENPLIRELLSNDCAVVLKQFKTQHPEILEIFVMDNRGLIVGESNITSDYLQADEAKWSEIFGKDAIWHGGLEFDESTETYGIQISVPVQNIGVICSTVNLKNIKEN
ncbi:PDC sensor domain-containing protein [candidate division KSB1 bacterium]|nr:PDC sensor domain-containing protein [candidate division KSB1 bacterium]